LKLLQLLVVVMMMDVMIASDMIMMMMMTMMVIRNYLQVICCFHLVRPLSKNIQPKLEAVKEVYARQSDPTLSRSFFLCLWFLYVCLARKRISL
jgi:hypothetical protein